MLHSEFPERVSVDVIKKNKQYFANIGFAQTQHALGPVKTRDEIYLLIFGFIQDIRLHVEIELKRKAAV